VSSQDGIKVIAESGGDPITIVRGSGLYPGICWSPDGRSIGFTSISAAGLHSLLATVDSNGTSQPTSIGEGAPEKYRGQCAWTPDGRSILVAGSELLRISLADKSETIVQPLRGRASAFSTDASRLYVAEKGDDRQWRLVQIDTATGKTIAASVLDMKTYGGIFALSPHPDGKRVALMMGGPKYDLWMLEGYRQPSAGGALRNWTHWFRSPSAPSTPAK
jgi:WD40 repeat protein